MHQLGIVDPTSNFIAGLSNIPMELEVNLHATDGDSKRKKNKKKNPRKSFSAFEGIEEKRDG